jgi:hypothetical protein
MSVPEFLRDVGYEICYRAEQIAKVVVFRCSMCGQCILRSTGFICPMRCPKQMRNGPCGGPSNGMCEVYRDRKCIWVRIYKRDRLFGQLHKIERRIMPLDWELWKTAAWLNVLSKKITLSGESRRIKEQFPD